VRSVAAALAVLAALASHAAGQTPETAGEFWPTVDVHAQLTPNLRALVFGGLKKGEDFPYQQGNVGVGFGYQWKRFSGPHLKSIDPGDTPVSAAGGLPADGSQSRRVPVGQWRILHAVPQPVHAGTRVSH
jgi:opacity protein-like surface antigen